MTVPEEYELMLAAGTAASCRRDGRTRKLIAHNLCHKHKAESELEVLPGL